MIRGTITARHILCHPLTIIGMFGISGYVKLLFKCIETKSFCFAEFLFKR